MYEYQLFNIYTFTPMQENDNETYSYNYILAFVLCSFPFEFKAYETRFRPEKTSI